MVKKKNLRFGYKIFLSSSKTGESVGNAKQTIFYFWPKWSRRPSISARLYR